MAARTFTSAGVNNLWSNPANWDGGATIPQEDDSVTIPSGQTCEYDYNSAYTTGIAGITITGTLKLTRTAGTYKLFMKAAAVIGGTGTFDCGTSVSPIPFAAKHTITGGTGWYIKGNDGAGMTMTVYAAEPAIPSVTITGAEAIGQTELSVDTDITGDIWADGDTVAIYDAASLGSAADMEIKVIAAGGRASGAITITAALAAAKETGAKIYLLTRNVRFVNDSTASDSGILRNFLTGKLTIAGGEFYNPREVMSGCYVSISGGVFRGTTFVLNACITSMSGGLITSTAVVGGAGAIYGVSSNLTMTGGVIAGHTIGIAVGIANITGGAIYSCTTGISGVKAFLSNLAIGNATAAIASSYNLDLDTVTINTYRGLDACAGNVKNSNISTNSGAGNIRYSVIKFYNTAFSSNENEAYTSLTKQAYTESYDHDQITGAYKAWTKGGVTTSQTSVLPTGYSKAYITVLENAAVEGYWQREITVPAGEKINIEMQLRKAVSMTYLPRCHVFLPTEDPFAGGTPEHTFTMTNSTDTWESETHQYDNSAGTEPVTIIIRFQGMNASGNVYSALSVTEEGGGGGAVSIRPITGMVQL